MKAGLIARALGGRRVGRGWTARCPAHDDHTPSLSIRDGAVRLGEIDELLMIPEGIETGLSALEATGYAAWAALWAGCVRTLILPSTVSDVIVLADGDDRSHEQHRS